ncbi:kunitz-type serine protease inhibitor nigrescinin-4 [Drosophila sechellia]|nr:kunitz-type serine protease inhibitor nigrescinin-4 [Drosophila sechellia]
MFSTHQKQKINYFTDMNLLHHTLIFLIGLRTSVALRHERCSFIANPGPCKGHFEMFAYDLENNVCVEFIYGGCGGNPNRFQTKEECILLCNALADEDDYLIVDTDKNEQQYITTLSESSEITTKRENIN